MKKVLLAAMASALLVTSCSQEEVVENVSNPKLETRSTQNEMRVENGILTFSNYEAYRQVYEDLHKLNKEELATWSQNVGYTSMLRQESFSPNKALAEDEEETSEESNEFELDPVRKALYSNRGLLAIGDTIYKVLGEYIYKVPASQKEILTDIEADPDSYNDIRFKHTYVLTPVPTGSEIINGIEYKDAIYQDKGESRTPLSYVSSKRREHVKFVATSNFDGLSYWLTFGFRGRAQKKKIGIWGNTFNDEVKWGQGYGIVTVNNFVKPDNVIAKRVENAKSSYNTDDAPYYIGPSGSIYCGVNGYFDCYKNDISKEEHYKCKFVLDVPDEDDKK